VIERFYLGAHHPDWLERTWVALVISHRRLAGRRTLPRAACPWALDSGGFTELSMHGAWQTTPAAYVDAVRLYAHEIGNLEWVAPQDWMCEPFMLAKTGLTVQQHQERTVANYLDLHAMAPRLPFVPVVQGWELADYLRCVELYDRAGVDLREEPLVGLGSVCRRQATGEIEVIAGALAGLGLRLHGFGVKSSGLARYAEHLASADSMAWSYDARRSPALPGHTHKNCANCMVWAGIAGHEPRRAARPEGAVIERTAPRVAAGYILAGKPSGLAAIVDGQATDAGMQHLFSRPGEWSLCGEAVWLEVQRAELVTALTWICARCQALAAGQPDPCVSPAEQPLAVPALAAVAAIRQGACPGCEGALTDPRRSAGGWSHCRRCRRGWAVETQRGEARPTWQDWPPA
jgi:hypothetical protein